MRLPLDPVGTPFYEHWTKIDNLASPLYFPAMLAEHPERLVAVVRAIANAAPGCVVFHCAAGKDRTTAPRSVSNSRHFLSADCQGRYRE